MSATRRWRPAPQYTGLPAATSASRFAGDPWLAFFDVDPAVAQAVGRAEQARRPAGGGRDGVAHRWGVTGLPETFFVSAQGRVVGHVIGAVSPAQLAAGIAAAQAGRALGVESGGKRRKTR